MFSTPLKFPYLYQYGIYRPTINIKLIYNNKSVIFKGLIDSGAPDCLFPGWIATFLGHRLEKGKPKSLSVAGEKIKAYLHQTYLKIGKEQFRCDMYYSKNLDNWQFGLLGQLSFFSHFKVEFNYLLKSVTLIPIP